MPRGEIVTVLGSNGAGKTTILKTISGIIDPRKGSVEFKGREIQRMDPDRSCSTASATCPRAARCSRCCRCATTCVMGAYTRRDRDGVARDMEAVYGYFPILRERADAARRLLSGGQQQMLAIAAR